MKAWSSFRKLLIKFVLKINNMNYFKRFKSFLLWCFITNRCKYCTTVIGRDDCLCDDCNNNLPRIENEKCKLCGAEKSRCSCKKRHKSFDGITSPFYYEGSAMKSIKLFKFSGKNYIAKTLAQDIAQCVKKDFPDTAFDLICCVPFSKHQKITRAYNPSELLAEEVALQLKIPFQDALEKLFDVKTQHNMSITLRKGNVHGIYDVKNGIDVKDKTVLLIDDIMTTGETLNSCAVILKIRGAESVYCATSALTAKNKER